MKNGYRDTKKLGSYLGDLKAKWHRLEDAKVKRYQIKEGIEIETEEKNNVIRVNGRMDGFRVDGKVYTIRLMVVNESLKQCGVNWVHESAEVENDRDQANQEFLRIKKIAEALPDGFMERD